MLVEMVEFWWWLILLKLHVPYCWLSWPLNPLNTELNPICHLLALLGAHHFLHVSRIRVNLVTLSGATKLTYIITVVICNLRVEWYGHCTVKQTKIFLSKVVKFTNGLWSTSFFGHSLYGNHKNAGYLLMWWDKCWRLPLVECMHECTVIVDKTVLFVACK